MRDLLFVESKTDRKHEFWEATRFALPYQLQHLTVSPERMRVHLSNELKRKKEHLICTLSSSCIFHFAFSLDL